MEDLKKVTAEATSEINGTLRNTGKGRQGLNHLCNE